ncbi:MAG: GntR family transcriptional regulator [Burkholderiaceae bacterium]|nr:GntR family transcriptional regulator [Burkholderiaceae bacterium]MDO9089959.1 GntR family transcriptional regulator [Burkholderiaceae bacterium]
MSTFQISQIRQPKTAEIVASKIRKGILMGELKPGDKLPSEAQLMARFETSRPTLREALRILEFQSLITIARGAKGGAQVKQVDAQVLTQATGLLLQARSATLGDVYQARAMIEPPAARLAAETRPELAARALQAQLERERAVADDERARAHEVAAFHRILLEQCGNVALAVVGQSLHDVVNRHLELAYRQNPVPGADERDRQVRFGLKSQERLIALISAGAGLEAEAHWVRHMKAAGEYWLQGLAGTAVIDILD